MIPRFVKFLGLIPFALLLGAAAGCTGEQGVTVSGKLILPENVKLQENDTVSLSFIPAAEGKKTGNGTVNPSDLSFTAKEVTPGKNKIAISIAPYPGPDNQKRTKALTPINQTYNGNTTKLEYEVTNEPQQSVTVDIAKAPGTVTKS